MTTAEEALSASFYNSHSVEYLCYGYIREQSEHRDTYVIQPNGIIDYIVGYIHEIRDTFDDKLSEAEIGIDHELNTAKYISSRSANQWTNAYGTQIISRLNITARKHWKFQILNKTYNVSFGIIDNELCSATKANDGCKAFYGEEKKGIGLNGFQTMIACFAQNIQYSLYYSPETETGVGRTAQFQVGDVIEMILDLNPNVYNHESGTLQFIINGKQQQKLPNKSEKFKSLVIDPTKEYRLAIAFYKNKCETVQLLQ
jgi:hypothetical protein